MQDLLRIAKAQWAVVAGLVALGLALFLPLPFIAFSDGASSWFAPSYNLKQLFSVWDTYGGVGNIAPNNITSASLRLFYSLFSIPNNPDFTQKAAWFTFFSVGSIILYLVCSRYIKERLVAASLAVLILINPIAQYFLWGKQHWAYYLTIPYFLGTLLTIKFLETQRDKWAYLNAVLWAVFSFVFNQPAYFGSFLIIQAALFIGFLIRSKEKKGLLGCVLRGSILFLLVNAVFILPLAIGGSQTLNQKQTSYASADPLPILRDTQNSSFVYSLFANSKGYGDFYLGNSMSSLIVLAMMLLLFLPLVRTTSINIEKRRAFWLYLLVLVAMLIIIFLFKGITPPFSDLSTKIYSIKIMYIFRDYKDKFAIGISSALCLSLFYVLQFRKDIFLRAGVVVLAVLSIILFVSRSWVPAGYTGSSTLSYLITVPLSSGDDYRVLNLPLVDYSFFYNERPDYAADNPMENILKHPVIYTTQTQTIEKISFVKEQLEDNSLSTDEFQKFLNQYSIRYILNEKNSSVREDANPHAYAYQTIEKYPFLKLVKETGDYQLYEYQSYKSLISGNGVTWKKINNSEFLIHSSGPTKLLFTDTYDPGWKIYNSGKTRKCTAESSGNGAICLGTPIFNDLRVIANIPVFDSTHLSDTEFGNQWSLTDSGERDYVLYYQPQISLVIGEAISVLTLIAGGAWAIILVRRRRNEF